jgi:hypothetical protein
METNINGDYNGSYIFLHSSQILPNFILETMVDLIISLNSSPLSVPTALP